MYTYCIYVYYTSSHYFEEVSKGQVYSFLVIYYPILKRIFFPGLNKQESNQEDSKFVTLIILANKVTKQVVLHKLVNFTRFWTDRYFTDCYVLISLCYKKNIHIN